MDGLQRSSISFRRQGSSGLVWDDKLLVAEFNQPKEEESAGKSEIKVEIIADKKPDPETKSSIESRSDGGVGITAGKLSPTFDPPSPKVSVCGFCSTFAKNDKTPRPRQRMPKPRDLRN